MAGEAARTENVRSLVLEQAVNVWKRKWVALAVAWTVCVVGWIGVMFVPQRYESDARVFVDVNGLLAPLLKGLVVDTTPSQSEGYLRQTLLSRPNLEQVIVLANLGGPSMSDTRREEMVDGLAAGIKVTTQGPNLVATSYTSSNPVVAKNVLDALLTVFAEKAASSSRAEMDKAQAFLNEQIASYDAQLRAEDQRRADFRKKYAQYYTDTGVVRPDVAQSQLAATRRQYEEAVASRDALKSQLAQVTQLLSVNAAPVVGGNGQVVSASAQVRLALAKRRLADLRLVYTEKHPDVLAAERAVSDLEAEISKGKGGDGDSQVSNPVYESIRLKLVDSEAMLPVLKQRVDKAQADYDRIKSLGADLPEVTAKAQDLDRDYDVIKKNYDELVKRREAANLSQAADDRSDRTQFRVVDPPDVPITPSFPDRLVLFSVVLILGLGAGVAAPLALAQIRPTFGSVSRLRELGLPVIGAITNVGSVKSVGRFGAATASSFATASAALLLFYGGLVFGLTGILKGIW